ncbi:acyltransferase family protein [Pontibacter sp. H259]|uniref:acyltransferase family protein n=1 Tax=Pontibacter sp. H259 TaxID=3133421 RepID=UPI0030C5726F
MFWIVLRFRSSRHQTINYSLQAYMIIRSIKPFDSDYLKGIGILIIMLHNYFHILNNAPGENEFNFSWQHTLNFLENLYSMPLDIARQFFSYFGHFGVVLFIFLSGYGLARKYSSEHAMPDYMDFILGRLRKLYPVLFFAIAFLFVYKAAIVLLRPGAAIDLIQFVEEAALKLTLLANLVPGQGFTVSGPWWFFSLLFQLYLLAPLVLRLPKKWLLAIIGFSWAVQLVILVAAPAYMEYARLNFIGHMPEFYLGIYFAKYNSVKIRNGWLALIGLLFIASWFNQYIWITANVLAALLMLAAYNPIIPKPDSLLTKFFLFFGRNSLYFFTVHGLCRAPFVPMGNVSVSGSVGAAVLYLLVVTVLSLVFKYLVTTITSFGRPVNASL